MGKHVVHPFPLRPGFTVYLNLPPDLTVEEAERLARHVRTLAVDGEEADRA